MGTRWGINRTVAQVHALLYISPKPLHAEAICEVLGVARSNVSNSLKELQGWGVARVVHVLGDRRDHFETLADVWEMFQVILNERKRREIDPTLAMLRECLDEAEKLKGKSESVTFETKRLSELYDFMSTTSNWYNQISKLPQTALIKMIKMGSKIGKMLGV
jgi:DNA-binding transcriptional regulator GbsR (MarR family)